MKKTIFLSTFIFLAVISFAQTKDGQTITKGESTKGSVDNKIGSKTIQREEVKKSDADDAVENGAEYEFERPLNVFAAAGFSGRVGDLYSVAVSPIDRTVQFDKVSPLNFNLTTGFIWNPFVGVDKVTYYKDKETDWKYEYKRKSFAVALLINIYNLNTGTSKVNYGAAIDGGFGVGYRKDNFCFLITSEFSYLKQPRQYFIDQYKDKGKTLVLYNSQEPAQSISTDDNSIFASKLYPSFGMRLAYTFAKQK